MSKTIKEIEEILKDKTMPISTQFITELKSDNRKGVQLLYKKWKKEQEEMQKDKQKYEQMSLYENHLYAQNIHKIAGVDEVGRGPLAGPVVAAAVILGKDFYLPGLNDSKALPEKKRDQYYQTILEKALAVGIGEASAEEIDDINIYEATKLAMKRAVENLVISPEYLLVDAMEVPVNIPQQSIIKGDAKSVSIAASSIVAKVTRDRMMKELGKKYPQYGFENHMGYGTAQHLKAIETYGIIDQHRRSFSPIKE